MNELIDLYSGFDRLHVKARLRLLNLNLQQLSAYFPPSGVLLDLGCGRGVLTNYLAKALPGNKVIGIDTNAYKIDVASGTVDGRANIDFAVQDALQGVMPPCTGILMTDFLHHLPRKEQAPLLKKVYDSLISGGVLVVLECDASEKPPIRYWLSYLSDIILYRSRSNFRSLNYWKALLKSMGFKVTSIRQPNHILSQVLFICRK